MSRDYVIAIAVSVLAHGALALSGYFDKPKAHAPAREESPAPALTVSLPPEEEHPPADDIVSDTPVTEVAAFTPPQLVDTPSFALDAAFTQTISPPPPVPPTLGILAVPAGVGRASDISKSVARIFELAALDQRPEIQFKTDPVYPRELIQSRLNGEVLLGFVVDSSGNVRDPHVVSSTHARFEAAALQAIVRWKFKPGRKDGAAVNTRVELPISFSSGA